MRDVSDLYSGLRDAISALRKFPSIAPMRSATGPDAGTGVGVRMAFDELWMDHWWMGDGGWRTGLFDVSFKLCPYF